MRDRELLEAAAKAAGYDWRDKTMNVTQAGVPVSEWPYDWNPLLDDGDAFRLAVKLRLMVNINRALVEVTWFDEVRSETFTLRQWDNDISPEEGTRRAIVRAAAKIGGLSNA